MGKIYHYPEKTKKEYFSLHKNSNVASLETVVFTFESRVPITYIEELISLNSMMIFIIMYLVNMIMHYWYNAENTTLFSQRCALITMDFGKTVLFSITFPLALFF